MTIAAWESSLPRGLGARHPLGKVTADLHA